MSDLTSSCNESSFTESKDEYISETFDDNTDYRKLFLQIEKYRQELHEMHLKLTHSEAMQRELQEANEFLEQSLLKEKKKAEINLQEIQEIQEKNRKIEEYENELSDLGTKLENKEKENKELHNLLKQHKTEISQVSLCKSDYIQEEELMSLKEHIQELSNSLLDKELTKNQDEEVIKNLVGQLSEVREILQITKDNLKETNEALETTREELAIYRTEIETLKTIPASKSCKGNSLFAEVEDRRQVLLNKASALKKKYDKIKQAYNAKVKEVTLLNMEKEAILKNKWDDHVNVFSEDNESELENKYKKRIRDLETTLTEVQKNNIEIKTTDTSFSYLESLLAEKKKEIQKLHQKIEHDSVNMLVQAEIKHKIIKQFEYWKCKAMHMEAQLSAIKTQGEIVEEYKTIFQDLSDTEERAAENVNKTKKVTSELTTLKDRSSVPYLKPTDMLERIVNADTSLPIRNNYYDCKAEKASDIDETCLDYDNSNKSEFENTTLEEGTNAMKYRETQNATLSCLNETQKLRKIVEFSEDTKNQPSDSMIKRNQNKEKKKDTKQYKIMYISSESSQ